jgi:hypothetical protein
MAAFAQNTDHVTMESLQAAIRELQWAEPAGIGGSVRISTGGMAPPAPAMADPGGGSGARAGEHYTGTIAGAAAGIGPGIAPLSDTGPAATANLLPEGPIVGRVLLACEGKTVMERELRPGRLVIGRTPDNDIQIDSKFISRHHCQIVTQFDACVIEDLNSTNGIYVKSKRVRRHNLNDGDVVQVGQHEVMYIDERVSRVRASGDHVETEIMDKVEP